MSRWTEPLLALATDPKISAARYGFVKGRTGGAQYPNPQGWAWPVSAYTNCVTWVVQALHLGRRMLGDDTPLTFADWQLGLQWAGEDERGAVLMAHRWGVATEPAKGWSEPPIPGQWYVCQGHRASGGGHAFLALAHAGGLVILEANGVPSGGAVLGGLDGVGSRCATPRCARDWPSGNWPPHLAPLSVATVEGYYDTLWTARLT